MRALPIVVAFVTAFSFVESASAHHATAAQYDTAKTVVLKGAISKLEWTNPHVHVYLDVAAANGRRETWSVEFASPGGIIVAGLSKELLKVTYSAAKSLALTCTVADPSVPKVPPVAVGSPL